MKKQLKRLLPVSLTLFLTYLVAGSEQAHAQEQKHVVQLSGLIISPDSLQDMSGVAVYVPYTSRGVLTIRNGFFSLPVLPGDSVVISMLGYQKQFIIIPYNHKQNSYTAHIQLQESTTELPTVDVMPWATVRDLRTAIARVKLPEERKLKIDLGPLQYKTLQEMPPMDAGDNAKHGIQQQLYQLNGRHMFMNGIRLFGVPIK